MARREALETPKGTVQFLAPSAARVDPLARGWRFPIEAREEGGDPERGDPERGDATFVWPFESTDGVVLGAYLPQTPRPRREALGCVGRTRRVIARAAQGLTETVGEGLALVCAVLRDEEGGVATPGVGVFVTPTVADQGRPVEPALDAVEAMVGKGCGVVVQAVLDALDQVGGLDPIVGVKPAAATHMGARWLDFAVFAGRVYALQEAVFANAAIWSALAEGGVEEVVHVPVGGSTPRRTPVRTSAKPARLSENGARRVYRILCRMAACDGHIDPREEALLEAYRERLNVPRDEARGLRAEGVAGENLRMGSRPEEVVLLLEALLDIAAADGVLAEEEQGFLLRLADLLGVKRASVQRRIEVRFPPSARPPSDTPWPPVVRGR